MGNANAKKMGNAAPPPSAPADDLRASPRIRYTAALRQSFNDYDPLKHDLSQLTPSSQDDDYLVSGGPTSNMFSAGGGVHPHNVGPPGGHDHVYNNTQQHHGTSSQETGRDHAADGHAAFEKRTSGNGFSPAQQVPRLDEQGVPFPNDPIFGAVEGQLQAHLVNLKHEFESEEARARFLAEKQLLLDEVASDLEEKTTARVASLREKLRGQGVVLREVRGHPCLREEDLVLRCLDKQRRSPGGDTLRCARFVNDFEKCAGARAVWGGREE